VTSGVSSIAAGGHADRRGCCRTSW
jgi:hypothetical protein